MTQRPKPQDAAQFRAGPWSGQEPEGARKLLASL
jgi:hypothetical protein